jgi:hypothetical protein
MLEPAAMTLLTGESESLTAIVQPVDATNQLITWAIDNKAVATVDSDGRVTAESSGTAKITATSQDGGHTATCTLTVLPETMKLFKRPCITVGVGILVPTFVFLDYNATANTSLEWHSDNEAVATVDKEGYIRGLSQGVATITCTAYDGKVQDTFTMSFVEFDLDLMGPYTGILSDDNGETVNSTSTMDILVICVDGLDFTYSYFELYIDLEHEGKKMSVHCDELLLIADNNTYSLYAETTFDGNPAVVSGTIYRDNASVNLKISHAKELVFQGSIKNEKDL